MIGRELTQLVGAIPCRREGRRLSVKVAPAYKSWAKRHQQVLRDALRFPGSPVDLTDGMSLDDLEALGVVKMAKGLFAHPLGDQELTRLLLLPRTEALALAAERRRRMQREEHALEQREVA
jgi:hypothetical protein